LEGLASEFIISLGVAGASVFLRGAGGNQYYQGKDCQGDDGSIFHKRDIWWIND
jgi:hypothetical protein